MTAVRLRRAVADRLPPRLQNRLLRLIRSRLPLNDTAIEVALQAKLVRGFVGGRSGADHRVTRKQREDLVNRFQEIAEAVPSATSWLSWVVLADRLLNIPPSTEGAVIECGCYKGASACALSLACELTDRKLYVCDSFEGLPEDESPTHRYPHLGLKTKYRRGSFTGSLEEVTRNLETFGARRCCELVPGYFSETLGALDGPFVFAFFDVDLATSMADCIKHLWPKFTPDAVIFTDDSCDMDVVKVWFDNDFWRNEVGEEPPGYIGSGSGLPGISARYSSLGYTLKSTGNLEPADFSLP